MSGPAGFTVAELRARAGEAAFAAAGQVAAVDELDEDEWSVWGTVRLDDGRTVTAALHHRAGGPLGGECDCPSSGAERLCAHQVAVGLAWRAPPRRPR